MDSVVLDVALARHQNRESMTHAKTFRQMPSIHTVAKYSIPGQVLNIYRHIVCWLEVTKYIGKLMRTGQIHSDRKGINVYYVVTETDTDF